MTTLETVGTRKKKSEPTAEEAAAVELVRMAKEQGLSLTGPDGLLKQFTKSVLETALNEELTEHLGHEKHRPRQHGGASSPSPRSGGRWKRSWSRSSPSLGSPTRSTLLGTPRTTPFSPKGAGC